MRPYYSPGGMTSPAVNGGLAGSRVSSASPSLDKGGQLSPSPARRTGSSLLPADWPRSQPASTAVDQYTAASPAPAASHTRSQSHSHLPLDAADGREDVSMVSVSQYAQLQADRAGTEVKLNQSMIQLSKLRAREKELSEQLTKERVRHTQVCGALLDACRASCPLTEIPELITSPEQAVVVSNQIRAELAQVAADRELTTTAVEAATAKVEELTVAVRDRDICIGTLEDKINTLQHSNGVQIESLENEVVRLQENTASLLEQIRIAKQSPVRSPMRSDANGGLNDSAVSDADATLLNWANTTDETMRPNQSKQPSPQVASRGPMPAPPNHTGATSAHATRNELYSPARAIRTPGGDAPLNTSTGTASTNPQSTAGEWPPSPRRQLNTSSTLNTTADTLPEEFPPSPRRAPPPPPNEEGNNTSPRRVRRNVTESGWKTEAGEEWPPSPRRTAPPQQSPEREWANVTATPDTCEYPPSPARNRGPPPQDADCYQGEYPPSPARNRGQPPAPVQEPQPAHEEWPPSPQRSRGQPPQQPQQQGKNSREWPPSPQRIRGCFDKHDAVPHQQPQQNERTSTRKEEWPSSPRRGQVTEDLMTPDSRTETESPIIQTPVDATPCDEGALSPHKLDYTATGSPKTQDRDRDRDREHLMRERQSSRELGPNDSSASLGGRRRSVGFVDVPSDFERRQSGSSDMGAARRAVDLTREPSELTPTAAKLRISVLERELREARGEIDPQPIDEKLRRRAEQAFNEVDALCQKDGSISKAELGRVLREEKLGAKILFHELDGDDSGEIDIGEWLTWFGKLHKKESADNMLEWIEERLATVKKVKEVDFAVECTVRLDDVVERRAEDVFDRILKKTGMATSIQKLVLQSVLRDKDDIMKDINTTESGEIRIEHWMEWIEGIQRKKQDPESTIAWVEMQVDATDPEAQRLRRENEELRASLSAVEDGFQDTTSEYHGPLTADHKRRAVDCFHKIDGLSNNNGTISQSELLRILRQEPLAAKVIFNMLHDENDGDIDMPQWISWFDSLERTNRSAENMLQWIEDKIAEATQS